jgi:hypothetical protein
VDFRTYQCGEKILAQERPSVTKNVGDGKFRYTVLKAMADFIVNNEKMLMMNDECFLRFIINNEIIHSFWDSVVARSMLFADFSDPSQWMTEFSVPTCVLALRHGRIFFNSGE